MTRTKRPSPAPSATAPRPELDSLEVRIRAGLGLRVPDSSYDTVVDLLATHAARSRGGVAELLDEISWSGATSFSARAIAEAVTSRHTHFFRDRSVLEKVCKIVVDRVAESATSHPVIWCAGCASGEEPYSLAMMLDQLDAVATIVATDLSHRALAKARRARYPESALRHVPAAMHGTYFEAQGDGTVQLAPHLVERVRFEHGELFTSPYPHDAPVADVVVCRNVLLYYDAEFAAKALLQLATALHPGGWLFLAPNDVVALRRTPGFRHRRDLGVGTFERIEDGTAEAVVQHWPMRAPRRTNRTLAPPSPVPGSSLRVTGRAAGAEAATGRRSQTAPATRRALRAEEDLEAWLADATKALADHDFDEARRWLEKATALHPASAEPWFLLGVVARKTGALDEALALLRRALILAPRLWPASLLMAGLWERRGELQRARRQYRATLEVMEFSSGAARPDAHRKPTAPPCPPLDRLRRLWSQMPDDDQARQLCLERVRRRG